MHCQESVSIHCSCFADIFVKLTVGFLCNPADGCTPDASSSDACPPWVRYVSANTLAASCNSGIAIVTATPEILTVSPLPQ